jgi:hypothetical protein
MKKIGSGLFAVESPIGLACSGWNFLLVRICGAYSQLAICVWLLIAPILRHLLNTNLYILPAAKVYSSGDQ